MDAWLKAAVEYILDWLDYQMQQSGQPGCVVAIAYKGRVVLEKAFGVAELSTGKALTPRHRQRAASHSKSFTAAGVMKLREAGALMILPHRIGPSLG
ncbi:MAG: serine hydrolase [Rhodospirillaceae bacterium]|nr:serine hydrolase [Rhodospirillaceae bacterium]